MPQTELPSPKNVPPWRGAYVWSFVCIALVFVPVLFNFGLVGFIVPALWGIASSVRAATTGHFTQALVLIVYFGIYFAAFFAMALLTDWIARKTPSVPVRIALRIAILCCVASCGFMRVLTYGSIQGRGGTYTFWTAAERFIEKRGNR